MSIVVRHDPSSIWGGLAGASGFTQGYTEVARRNAEINAQLKQRQNEQNQRMMEQITNSITGMIQQRKQDQNRALDRELQVENQKLARADRLTEQANQRDWITKRDETNYNRQEARQLGVPPENLEEYKGLYSQAKAAEGSGVLTDEYKTQVLSSLKNRMDALKQPMPELQSMSEYVNQNSLTNPDGSTILRTKNGPHFVPKKENAGKPEKMDPLDMTWFKTYNTLASKLDQTTGKPILSQDQAAIEASSRLGKYVPKNPQFKQILDSAVNPAQGQSVGGVQEQETAVSQQKLPDLNAIAQEKQTLINNVTQAKSILGNAANMPPEHVQLAKQVLAEAPQKIQDLTKAETSAVSSHLSIAVKQLPAEYQSQISAEKAMIVSAYRTAQSKGDIQGMAAAKQRSDILIAKIKSILGAK